MKENSKNQKLMNRFIEMLFLSSLSLLFNFKITFVEISRTFYESIIMYFLGKYLYKIKIGI